MMNVVLFDTVVTKNNLLPFTFTRPIADIRCGILKISEKWGRYCQTNVSFLTESYLQGKYIPLFAAENLYINGAVCPDPQLFETVISLRENQALVKNSEIIAVRSHKGFQHPTEIQEMVNSFEVFPYDLDLNYIAFPWDIFLKNREEIIKDFKLVTENRESHPVKDKHTIIYGLENIFIEEGASVKAAILNGEDGPIYIGKNAVINEGAVVKGAFALGEGGHISIGAKIRGDNSFGPYCKVGGEVSNSVMFGYSNKSHDGYLGNSVLGEWCNLGADTNSSNLKNNYSNVKIWNYHQKGFMDTGRQFCGLLMGDHSKSGINTMFNTGTVVGLSANVYGSGFPPKFIPSFSWGGPEGLGTFRLDKALGVAERVMGRRDIPFTKEDSAIFEHVYQWCAQYR